MAIKIRGDKEPEPDTLVWLEDGGMDRVVLRAARRAGESRALLTIRHDGIILHAGANDTGIKTDETGRPKVLY